MHYGGLPHNGAAPAGGADFRGIKNFGIRRYRRMNVWAMCLAAFLPWLVGCLVYGMLAFHMHYQYPALCNTVGIVGFVILLAAWLVAVWGKMRSPDAYADARQGTWRLFVITCCLLFCIAAVYLGNKTFWSYTQVFYDLSNLNTYKDVNPATVDGVELMDAGLVTFVQKARVDLKRAMSFKNSETYCVAPITLPGIPSSSYDFWAVGLNCCGDASVSSASVRGSATSFSAAPTDWTCGDIALPQAHAGVRVMRNEDRSYYRLAVQQAQSAFNIKATHPLFFYWTTDPVKQVSMSIMECNRQFLMWMYATFGVQLLLVALASCYFVEHPTFVA